MRVFYLIIIFLMFLNHSGVSYAGVNAFAERVPHNKSQFENIDYDDIFLRIVIKFHDGTGIRAEKLANVKSEYQSLTKLRARGLTRDDILREVNELNNFLNSESLVLSQLIDAPEEDVSLMISNAEQFWNEELAELQTYAQIVLKNQNSSILREWIADLMQFDIIEIVYPEAMATPFNFSKTMIKPDINNSCELNIDAGDLSIFQGYRYSSPKGVGINDIDYLPNSKGKGVKIISIEGGYEKHVDHNLLFQITGHPTQFSDHGTMVVGVLSGIENGVGIDGLAPESEVGVRSIYNQNLFEDWNNANSSSANVANNIYWASKHSMNGVILIELQRSAPEEPNCVCSKSLPCKRLPMEYWSAEFDVIKVATGNGTVVVEAAGNGGRNLDHDVLLTCEGGCFDRDIRDSGAILVSGSLDDGITPICESSSSPNFGERIDVHSWAENVATTSLIKKDLFFEHHYTTCNRYTQLFNGTSSATAIIAGVVSVLKGIHQYNNMGENIDSLLLRKIITGTGAQQESLSIEGQDILIGTHPNLVEATKAIQEL